MSNHRHERHHRGHPPVARAPRPQATAPAAKLPQAGVRHPGPWRRSPEHPFWKETGRRWHDKAGPWEGRGPLGGDLRLARAQAHRPAQQAPKPRRPEPSHGQKVSARYRF